MAGGPYGLCPELPDLSSSHLDTPGRLSYSWCSAAGFKSQEVLPHLHPQPGAALGPHLGLLTAGGTRKPQ